ncbi:MAG: ADP-ribosylglycohydrolase family protein [Candidatus Aureabacteria bacterium]|nr:ADP-ribosylglycohydrolase family protein [Candidatus Auribacterota bacterium]
MINKKDRLKGVLLGTAIGDALGLPFEGLSSNIIKKKFKDKETFYFFGNKGVVSDDTELSALLAQSLLKSNDDLSKLVKYFKRSLLGWFLRLPWGIGYGTLRSCLKIAFGFKKTGAPLGSAGNGAAMRASILGVYINDNKEKRLLFGKNVAVITHLDKRAVEGAQFIAEVSAILSNSLSLNDLYPVIDDAKTVIENKLLNEAVNNAIELAKKNTTLDEAVKILKNTGYIVNTTGLVTFCFLSFGKNPINAIYNIILAGGDTDTNAAIIGAWLGAYYGTKWIPEKMLNKLQKGPFGKKHLEKLGTQLSKENDAKVPNFSWTYSLIRNILLYPVILIMGVSILFHRKKMPKVS